MKRYVAIACAFLFFLGITAYRYVSQLPPPEESVTALVTFLDRNSEPFAQKSFPKRSNWISLEEISPYVVQGFIATEDQHFYKHHGFDYGRIFHSLWTNAKEGNHHFGASTITQQYARNLFNNFEKTWKRKFKEAIYTIRLETHYSKDDLLEGYLNTINFGHGAYGIEDASLFYFNKHASELNLAEASLLVGIPKAPAHYSPLFYADNAKSRQQVVLTAMAAQSFIDEREKQFALAEEFKLVGSKAPEIFAYYLDGAYEELTEILAHRSFKHLTVQTTLDLQIQQHVNESIAEHIEDADLQTAVIVMEPATGHVLALNGGQSYEQSTYNRALKSRRQIGSLIKPFLYYGALEYGFTPATNFSSQPTSFLFLNNQEPYSPQNYSEQYAESLISMANALAVSDNIFAVKTHTFLGMDVLASVADRLGVSNVLELPSSALGVNTAGMMEMTEAYGVFANEGRGVKHQFITSIQTPKKTIYEASSSKMAQILEPNKTFILNEMMTGMFNPLNNNHLNATGHYLAPKLSRRYAGKTGTTATDSWMIGYNPELIATVWVGYDQNRLLKGDSSSHHIWADIMENSLSGDAWYEPTDNVFALAIDAHTGQPSKHRNSVELYFEQNNFLYKK